MFLLHPINMSLCLLRMYIFTISYLDELVQSKCVIKVEKNSVYNTSLLQNLNTYSVNYSWPILGGIGLDSKSWLLASKWLTFSMHVGCNLNKCNSFISFSKNHNCIFKYFMVNCILLQILVVSVWNIVVFENL